MAISEKQLKQELFMSQMKNTVTISKIDTDGGFGVCITDNRFSKLEYNDELGNYLWDTDHDDILRRTLHKYTLKAMNKAGYTAGKSHITFNKNKLEFETRVSDYCFDYADEHYEGVCILEVDHDDWSVASVINTMMDEKEILKNYLELSDDMAKEIFSECEKAVEYLLEETAYYVDHMDIEDWREMVLLEYIEPYYYKIMEQCEGMSNSFAK